MRLRALGAAVATIGLLAGGAGCTRDTGRSAATPASRPTVATPIAPTLPAPSADATGQPASGGPAGSSAPLSPASAAGGACAGITFAEVAAATGTWFGVAAASGGGGARSCVLQRIGVATPDLTFTVLPASGLTVADYKADLIPSGSTAVKGLGQAAYSRVLAPAAAAGPRVEVGWLGTGRTYTVSYTTTAGTADAAARAYLPRLVELGPRLVG